MLGPEEQTTKKDLLNLGTNAPLDHLLQRAEPSKYFTLR